MKTIIALAMVLLLAGCTWPGSYFVEIEQKVKCDSILSDNYRVITYVWVYDWIGSPVTIESLSSRTGVSCHEIAEIKDRQMETALIIKEAAERRLKTWKKCEASS